MPSGLEFGRFEKIKLKHRITKLKEKTLTQAENLQKLKEMNSIFRYFLQNDQEICLNNCNNYNDNQYFV